MSLRSLGLLGVALLGVVACGGNDKEIQSHYVRDRLEEDDAVNRDGMYFDSYWFRGLENGTAIANIDSSEFDPELFVYDEEGRLIVHDEDSGAGDDARASFRVGFNKFYEVIVTSNREAEVGRYDLNVSRELQFDSVITRSKRQSGFH